MHVLTYKQLESALHQPQADPKKTTAAPSPAIASVILIHGEEMLVKSALKMMIDVLVPAENRSAGVETIDGSTGNLHEAVEKACTYPLLGGCRVVALLDARLFDSKKNPAQQLKKSREACESQRLQKAASHLLDFMALANVDLDDLTGAEREVQLQPYLELIEDGRWLDEVVKFCRQTGRTQAVDTDATSLLEKTIEAGIPKGNRLILTTETVDRRKKLYDLIKEKGLVIDCSVPQGERRADKLAQEAVLQEIKTSQLKKHGKTMEPGAFEVMYEMIGFEPRTFSQSLEKLITYTGNRRRITREDVETVLERTRQDPIFFFTNAVVEKRTAEALFFLDSLLHDPQQPMRPEQIIVAILNQVRKLMRIKEFVESAEGHVWSAGCSFGQFKSVVLSAILEYDRKLDRQIGQWRETMTDGGGKKFAGKKGSDLSIAPQPKNPYPVFQLFNKSEKFSAGELRQAVEHLARADRWIKSGAENKQLILENLVWSICGGKHAIDKNRMHHRSGE